MLHQLAGATIQIANLVNYNCHPLQDGNNTKLSIRKVSNKDMCTAIIHGLDLVSLTHKAPPRICSRRQFQILSWFCDSVLCVIYSNVINLIAEWVGCFALIAFLYLRGEIRKFAENSCHFYIA